MSRALFLATAFAIVASASVTLAADMTISTSTVWSGTVTIDGKVTVNSNADLTIQPGTTVNFVGSAANLSFSGSGAFSAQGTAAQPIYFTGSQCGLINGAPNRGMTFDHCVISGLGGASTSSTDWFNCNPQGLSIANSSITNCGPLDTAGSSGATISNCTLTNLGRLYMLNSGGDTVTGCKINGVGKIRLNSSNREEASYNIIVNSTIWSDGTASVNNILVHDNYIDDTAKDGTQTNGTIASTSYGIQGVNGQIYNNVVHGGSWSIGFCGGHIYNNVIEALRGSEITQHGDSTHEQLNDFKDNAVVEHNIILNNSMGSFMTANGYNALNCVIRNNTFDQRAYVGTTASGAIYLNHLGGPAANMLVSNNLFMRGGRLYDETSVANAISYVDYNCWAGRNTDGFSGSSSRFVNILITGKTEGNDGFGMHDVTLATNAQGFNPATVVQNADYTNPYTDAQMLAGACTPAQLLALYQQAFTPVPGSPVINAGDPNYTTDPAMTYGRIDIGAVEAPVVLGDANLDRITDFHDYIILEQNFGKSGMTWAQGDFNNDHVVDYHDYILLEQGFGKSTPEPVTLSLLAAGALALLRRKR